MGKLDKVFSLGKSAAGKISSKINREEVVAFARDEAHNAMKTVVIRPLLISSSIFFFVGMVVGSIITCLVV